MLHVPLSVDKILINFPNVRQTRKLLVVSGGRFSQEIFWILTPESPLPWDSESFRWDIGQISTWKLFFIIKNIFIMENLTDLRKTVETSVDLCLNKGR